MLSGSLRTIWKSFFGSQIAHGDYTLKEIGASTVLAVESAQEAIDAIPRLLHNILCYRRWFRAQSEWMQGKLLVFQGSTLPSVGGAVPAMQAARLKYLQRRERMDATERAAQLARQLQATADAHFVYESSELNGVYDEQWSDWYAAYLLARDWNAFFERAWSREALAEELRRCHAAHRAATPDSPWVAYYAAYFAEMT